MPGTSTGLGDVNREAVEITNVVIGNVGGAGTYTDVVSMAPGQNMECTDTAAACVKEVSRPACTSDTLMVFFARWIYPRDHSELSSLNEQRYDSVG